MKTTRIEVLNPDRFEFNKLGYDIRQAVKIDIKDIIMEAKTRKNELSNYDLSTISPKEVEIFSNEKGEPVFVRVLYIVMRQDWRQSLGILPFHYKHDLNLYTWAFGNYYHVDSFEEKHWLNVIENRIRL